MPSRRKFLAEAPETGTHPRSSTPSLWQRRCRGSSPLWWPLRWPLHWDPRPFPPALRAPIAPKESQAHTQKRTRTREIERLVAFSPHAGKKRPWVLDVRNIPQTLAKRKSCVLRTATRTRGDNESAFTPGQSGDYRIAQRIMTL